MAEKLYYQIGELAAELGVPTSTIRFWESRFSTLRPRTVRRSTGRRFYSKDEADKVRMVHYLLKVKKMTLEGVREYIEADQLRNTGTIDVIQTLTRLRAELDEIRKQLGRMSGTSPA